MTAHDVIVGLIGAIAGAWMGIGSMALGRWMWGRNDGD